MERLTKKDIDYEFEFCKDCRHLGEPNGCNRNGGECEAYFKFTEIARRLAELEDELENGTLVEPPCKLGDTVYCVIQPDDEEPYIDDTYKCESLRYYNGEWEITPNMDGWWWTIEKVCATREEAEKRLEELRGC